MCWEGRHLERRLSPRLHQAPRPCGDDASLRVASILQNVIPIHIQASITVRTPSAAAHEARAAETPPRRVAAHIRVCPQPSCSSERLPFSCSTSPAPSPAMPSLPPRKGEAPLPSHLLLRCCRGGCTGATCPPLASSLSFPNPSVRWVCDGLTLAGRPGVCEGCSPQWRWCDAVEAAAGGAGERLRHGVPQQGILQCRCAFFFISLV